MVSRFQSTAPAIGSDRCIIADDFTGAADSGIQLRRSGARVLLVGREWTGQAGEEVADVLVVNTDSRSLSSKESYDVVRDTVLKLQSSGRRRIFKKIDSTIRGNIEGEIAAILDCSSYSRAVIAPSAPRNGRTVIGGRCLIDGVPLDDSSVGRDPYNPVPDSSVAARFSGRFREEVAAVELHTVRGGPKAVHERLVELFRGGARIVVVDAETIDDLRVVASAGNDESILLVGSSGLAEALAGGGRKRPVIESFNLAPDRILLVVGSVTETTREQVRYLAASGSVRAAGVRISALLAEPGVEIGRVVDEVAAFSPSVALVLTTGGSSEDAWGDLAGAVPSGLSTREAGERISMGLAETVREILLRRRLDALFVTGGSTAARVADALDSSGFELVEELLPGIPLGTLSTPLTSAPLIMVTKSGGFGSRTALVEVLSRLTGARQSKKGGKQ